MRNKMIVLSALVLASSAWAAEGPQVSGFVHGMGSFTDTDLNGDKGDLNFSVPDGAVYFQHQVAGIGAFVDLPFSASTGSAISIDMSSKGQAYVHHTAESGLGWKLGQWDSPFGYKSKDSVDKTFNIDGQVATNLPKVHKGLSLAHALGDSMDMQVFVANPSTFLTNAPSTGVNNDKLETGLNLKAKTDSFTLELGAMYGRAYAKNHWAVFSNIGFDMGGAQLGLELDYLNDKDVIQYRQGGKLLSALYVDYATSDVMNIGLRAEYMRHGDASLWTATVGPQYQIEKDFALRVDYTVVDRYHDFAQGIHFSEGDAYFSHTFAIGAVARF